MHERRRVGTLQEIRQELVQLDPDHVQSTGAWTVGQVLSHCAQSLEFSLTGFPMNKPAWFLATLGRLALWKFLKQGFMRHDVAAPIPGAPPPPDLTPREARDRLVQAIDAFERHAGPLAPHFAYGPVDKERYGRVQAMHIAEHLEHLPPRPMPLPT